MRCSTSTSEPPWPGWGLALALGWLLTWGAWDAPAAPMAPAEAPSPPPTVLPALPEVIPGPGIYYPDWQEAGPHERFATPAPGPGGLPRHVGLGKAEREVVARLEALVARLEGHLDAHRLASARVALGEAEDHVVEAESQHLMLRLYESWTKPRFRLLDLRARLTAARRGPVDAESLAASRAALRALERRLAPLWEGLERLPPEQAEQRLLRMRRWLREAGEAPLLVENPGWLAVRAPLVARLAQAEAGLAIRVGQVRLLDATCRIDRLRAEADRRLASGDLEAATGDLQALEEACAGFEHEYAELVARGYDPAGLAWIGAEGEWRGRAVLARVQRWRQEARRRLGVLGGAPAAAPPPRPPAHPAARPAPPAIPTASPSPL
ncbi:MAG: hypothetical protein VKQ33_02195 [Candidatus Sericytochromatia bacterium]|nr:hypothetical protein [Candidatus Sericytochromatia bacterium]